MDQETPAATGIATRTIRIGQPITSTWEEFTVESVVRGDHVMPVVTLARVEWLKLTSQTTIEAWDVTEQKHPELLCAWTGRDYGDQARYLRLCRMTGAHLYGRGYLPAGSRGSTPDWTGEIDQVVRLVRNCHLAHRTAVPARHIYESGTVAKIDALARQQLSNEQRQAEPTQLVREPFIGDLEIRMMSEFDALETPDLIRILTNQNEILRDPYAPPYLRELAEKATRHITRLVDDRAERQLARTA